MEEHSNFCGIAGFGGNTTMTGKLIVIDGIDGVGKTTQIEMLCDELDIQRIEHIVTHEPQSDQPIGHLIYEYLRGDLPDPYTMALLYTADRNEHVKAVIQPALNKGLVVITDRYHCSTVAYQGVHISKPFLWGLGVRFPEPDLVFLISGDHWMLDGRTKPEEKDNFEKDLAFQEAVRRNFLEMGKNRRYIILEARLSPELIHKEIMREVEKIID